MRVWSGRLRAAGLAAVVAAALAAIACAQGTGSAPLTVDLAQTPTSTQAPPQTPVVSPVIATGGGSAPSRSPTPLPAKVAARGSAPGAGSSPAAGSSAAANEGQPWQRGMQVTLGGPSAFSGPPKVQTGAILALTLESRPTMYRRGASGNERVMQTQAWERHDVAEMRFCLSIRETADGPLSPPRVECTLPSAWGPFAPSHALPIEVSWIDQGEIMVRTQFRRADGTIVESIASNFERVEIASAFFWANSVLDPSVPISSLPPSVQAAAAERLAVYPVTGSVKIKNSPCCIGGPVGITIMVPVTFNAASPHGPVTEMLLGAGGCNTSRLKATSGGWEPFVAQRDMPVTPSSYLSSLSVAVQYRDAAGNVSAVHCDSVGVEGIPPRP